MIAICKQLKLKAKDGKSYLTDAVNENGITLITALIPAKNKENFSKWIKGIGSTVDEKSKLKAYELFESGLIDDIEVGTTTVLQQIHGYIFSVGCTISPNKLEDAISPKVDLLLHRQCT